MAHNDPLRKTTTSRTNEAKAALIQSECRNQSTDNRQFMRLHEHVKREEAFTAETAPPAMTL
jgi:hypothetical protein